MKQVDLVRLFGNMDVSLLGKVVLTASGTILRQVELLLCRGTPKSILIREERFAQI